MKRICQQPTFLRRQALRHLCILTLLTTLLVTFPVSAKATVADIILLLQNITSTLQNGIGTALSGIKAVNNNVMNLQQQVIWPLSAINQAKSSGSAIKSHYQNLFAQAASIPLTSATLVNPLQLEAAFRSGNSGNLIQVQAAYTQVYGRIPSATNAPAMDRNLMDMDDAAATASLKTTVISDQNSRQMLTQAGVLEAKALASAPGSAPLLTAQAQVANLANQAYLAKMLAAELRLEATKLAHDNTVRKKSAVSTGTLRQQLQQVLSHP
jgi:hypothetical protein